MNISISNGYETFNDGYLRYNSDGSIDLMGLGTYGRSSVLAGQDRKVFIDSYASEEDIPEKYKDLPRHGRYTEPQNHFNHLPDGPDLT